MSSPFGDATNLNVGASSLSALSEPAPPSRSPEAPKLKTADLPDVDEPWPELAPDGDVRMADAQEDLPSAGLFDHVESFPSVEFTDVPDRPLIAPLAPMITLREEYENGSQGFVRQIDWLLSEGWIGIRRTRGDGDCFYRSLAFAYIENILNASDTMLAAMGALSVLEASQATLEKVGFQRLVFEDFYDALAALINQVVNPVDGRLLNINLLLEAFNNPEISNSVVVYLRLLTSAEIKTNPDYAAFLFHPETGEQMDPELFCNNFVEAVGKEADHVQMNALATALKVNVNVAYLDGHDQQGKVSFVPFQNAPFTFLETINLLYRPGHYDILDRRDADPIPPLLV
ncbi:peptidase C65 Otubain-domain-containing protein [Fomes fomentarius]|nr:peptidase C65 Otubain-domain-containing protein [Fomes fomentarius]